MYLRAELIPKSCVNLFVDIKTTGMKHYFNKNSLRKLKSKCPKLPSWTVQVLVTFSCFLGHLVHAFEGRMET